MTPPVVLSPATFSRLQNYAVPLVDTIESVINRLLDAYETKRGTQAAPTDSADDTPRRASSIRTHRRI